MATGGYTTTPSRSPGEITPDRANFFRLCLIILDDVPEVLREAFLNVYKKYYTGSKWSARQGQRLRKEMEGADVFIYDHQKKLINEGDLSKWDTTLLCLVLSANIWGNKLSVDKRNAVDDIRKIRNDCFHHSTSEVSSDELSNSVRTIERAYRALIQDRSKQSSSIERMKQVSKVNICAEDTIMRLQVRVMEQKKQIESHCNKIGKELRSQSGRIDCLENKRLVHIEEQQFKDHSSISEHEEKLQDLEDRMAGVQEELCTLKVRESTPPYTLPKKPKKSYSKAHNQTKYYGEDSGVVTVEDSDLDISETSSIVNTTGLSTLHIEEENSPQATEPFNEQATSSPLHTYHPDTDGSIHQPSMQESAGPTELPLVRQSSSDNMLNETALAVGVGFGIGVHERPGRLKLALEESEKDIVTKDFRIKELSKEKEEIEQQLRSAQEELKHLKTEKSKDVLAIKELQDEVSKLTAELVRKETQITSERQLWQNIVQQQQQMLTMKDKHHEDMTQVMEEKHRADIERLVLRIEKSSISSSTPEFRNEGDGIVFERKDRLGGGAFGVVYKVIIDGKEYAAKELNHPFDAARMREFLILPQLKHENIVCYYGSQNCIPGRRPTLIMELMVTNLHVHIESQVMSTREKLQIARNVLCGLQYLHNHTPIIIHRDLTAKNVLLDSSGVAKVADFGNARLLDESQLSGLSCGLGTQGYRAPEVLSSTYCEKADIFSFGHLLLFLFIGEFPGKISSHLDETDDGKRIYFTEVQRRKRYIESLQKLCTKLKLEAIDKAVKDCLSCMPKGRPSASDLCETFSSIMNEV